MEELCCESGASFAGRMQGAVRAWMDGCRQRMAEAWLLVLVYAYLSMLYLVLLVERHLWCHDAHRRCAASGPSLHSPPPNHYLPRASPSRLDEDKEHASTATKDAGETWLCCSPPSCPPPAPMHAAHLRCPFVT